MSTVEESTQAPGPLAASLRRGLETLSVDQVVTFTQYVKLILPLDGYVFWVKADLVSASALANAYRLNDLASGAANAAPRVLSPAKTIDVKGSLHYSTENRQDEDKNSTTNYVVFTSERQVNDLDQVGPYMMYIAEFFDPVDAAKPAIQFAFSRQDKRYQQAGLWHYRGDAVYSIMQTQLIDKMDGFDSRNVIVSNSLPIWLALNEYGSVYPSFLVEQNAMPPFIAAHILPESTEAIGQAPTLDRDTNQYQLVQETVRLTVWGFRNFNVMDYLKYLCDDSLARPDVWGLMNMPVVRDEKLTQRELSVIAMKKTITLQVNYYQQRVRNIARQLILSAFISINISGA